MECGRAAHNHDDAVVRGNGWPAACYFVRATTPHVHTSQFGEAGDIARAYFHSHFITKPEALLLMKKTFRVRYTGRGGGLGVRERKGDCC